MNLSMNTAMLWSLLAVGTLNCTTAPGTTEASDLLNPTRAQRAPGIADLLATEAAPALADDLILFGQFVGDWRIRSETYQGGKTSHDTGRVHMGWALYGTAIQDVWTSDKADARPGYPQKSFGTTIRFFDPAKRRWRVVWVAPVEGVIKTFTATEIGGEIVIMLDGRNSRGNRERWIWANYTTDRFEWRAEEASEGQNWRVIQRIWGTRIA